MTASPPRRTSSVALWLVPLLVVLLVGGAWLLTRPSASGGPGSAASASAGVGASTSAHTPRSGLHTIAESALPPQARHTLALIRAGGPYPYRQDDKTWSNRERILPQRATGYYREYTVEKPGSPDRGPWRIIRGRDGDLYWTDDHYASFEQIEEGR